MAIMVICIVPLSESANSLGTSKEIKINSNYKDVPELSVASEAIKVKADYIVTVPQQVPVYYKVKIKVKVAVKYKSRGKWKTRYKYVYQYVYKIKYYKTVYTSYSVRDIPPGECNQSTANCQSDDPRIIALSQNLTQNLTNSTMNETEPQAPAYNGSSDPTSQEYQDYINSTEYQQYLQQKQQYDQDYANFENNITLEKATNIFNWVRDSTDYSFYYNTKYGALGMLQTLNGNCVDTTHLLIALERAAGIPARYISGNCQFSSGTWYGHVWAQIWVAGQWYTADAISLHNTFGTITNWNIGTYTLKGIYSSLPF
jgi:predicted nucleic acid-binding protein